MFNALDQGIIAFKQDYGDYPPSRGNGSIPEDYCGAMTLTEALLGWDLMGFHPESEWRADAGPGGSGIYDADDNANLERRRDRYIDIDSVDPHRFCNIYYEDFTPNVDTRRYVICDVFSKKRITTSSNEVKRVGTPVVYFKANISGTEMDGSSNSRYHYYDNQIIFNRQVYEKNYNHDLADSGTTRPGASITGSNLFYSGSPDYQYKVIDKEVTEASGRPWPHRPDSYILISAGPDGNFGTEDDVTNF
jgi:hypothetical protein